MSKLWQLGAAEIAARVSQGEISAIDITEQALARLQAVNPAINAVVKQMPEEALAAAKAIDNKISAGEPPGQLAGVPVTVKVNVDQLGHATTNGLRIQETLIANRDSPVITNLRRAGAIIIGRTNTPAFSMRWFTRNSLHGHTLNPRNRSLTPGGSSGGAAAAVATGIGAIAHGTDIAGSIRYPAYACGLHGIRPTQGRIAAVNFTTADRHIGAQLTAVSGPIARSVEDLRLGFEALAVGSEVDPWWVPVPTRLEPVAKRAALCIAPDGLEVAAEIVTALRETARQLVDAGWEVTEIDCPPMRQAMHLQLLLWMSEYHFNGAEAVTREDDPDASFIYAQLIEYCPTPTLESLMEALQTRVKLAREWQQFSTEYPLLLCPVSGELPFTDMLDIESPQALQRVVEAQLPQIALPFMGMPAMTLTTGSVDNIPLGVQLVAARFREDVLFDAATEIEARNAPIEIANPDWG